LRLLLDSHILLWWADGSPQLGARAKTFLAADGVRLFISAASWWELSIKKAHGRLNVDLAALGQELAIRGVDLIDIKFTHTEAAANLPPIHGDPFDRMLVAQATAEGLRLLTRDRQLKAYGPVVLHV